MNIVSNKTFRLVSTFWSRALAVMPKQFQAEKTPTRMQAISCCAPRRKVDEFPNSGCCQVGKKNARYPANARAVAAMGAEKPARSDTHPVMQPQVGPYARL